MWRKRAEPRNEAVSRRVARMSDRDLVEWADNSLYTAGRYLTAFQRERDPVYLEEARVAAEALLEVIDEVTRRQRP